MTDSTPSAILAEAMDIYWSTPAAVRAGKCRWRVNSDHMTELEATQPRRDPEEPLTDEPAYLCGFPMVVDDSVTVMVLERMEGP